MTGGECDGEKEARRGAGAGTLEGRAADSVLARVPRRRELLSAASLSQHHVTHGFHDVTIRGRGGGLLRHIQSGLPDHFLPMINIRKLIVAIT